MARVYDNAITKGTIGTLGNVYFRYINGKTFISKMPVQTSPRSKKQKCSSRKFKKAVKYALAALKDPVMSAIYKKAAIGLNNGYTTAIGDYMKPPVVKHINISPHSAGCPGYVYAFIKNVVQVKEVSMTITSADGFVIASGPAESKPGKNDWNFTKFCPEMEPHGFSVTVTATDLAGNKATGKRHFPDGKPIYLDGNRICGAGSDNLKAT